MRSLRTATNTSPPLAATRESPRTLICAHDLFAPLGLPVHRGWEVCWSLKQDETQGFPPAARQTPPNSPFHPLPLQKPNFLFDVSFFFFFKLINLFMAVLGLRFCARAFSSCGKWGPLLITVRGPLTVAASLVAEHRLQTRRLSNCGSRAQLLRGIWDLPRPGLEPVSPALAGGFLTTVPPGKPP